jgi:hypothetical protein
MSKGSDFDVREAPVEFFMETYLVFPANGIQPAMVRNMGIFSGCPQQRITLRQPEHQMRVAPAGCQVIHLSQQHPEDVRIIVGDAYKAGVSIIDRSAGWR